MPHPDARPGEEHVEDNRTAERHSLSDHQVLEEMRVFTDDLSRRLTTMENLMGRFIAGGLDDVQFQHLSQIYAARTHTH